IFILFINPFGIHSYKILSHNESEPGYQVHQILTNHDGTSVIYLTKPINETCNEPSIDFRIIRPDGAVDITKVHHPIPDFNFCLKPNNLSLHIKLFGNMQDNVIILYENSTNINSASFYALLVNARTGNVISNTFLSLVSTINGTLSFSGDILPHINEEYGFLFWSFITETKIRWIYFSKPDSDGNFKPINSNQFELLNPLDRFNIFAAIDGTFGLVTSNYNTNASIQLQPNVDLINPTEPMFGLYITFIKPSEDAVDGPFLLYQTAIPTLRIVFQCNSIYTTMGYFCILNMNEVQPKEESKNYLIKITFQNTGSVIDVEKFSNLELYTELYNNLSETTIFESLYHGGFLVLYSKNSENNHKTVQAIILDNNGFYNNTLDFPKNLEASNYLAMPGFRDSNFIIAQQENEYTWKVYSEEYPKFVYYADDRDIFAEDAIGRFSLTTEGTEYYEGLSTYDQKRFLSQLRVDLAKSIPIDINRLDNIKFYKFDQSQRPPKILLSLLIKSTRNSNERNVDRIIKDLNILIKEKDITPISWFNTTMFLDANFGFQKNRNLFDEYKFYLVGIAIGIIILGLSYFYAKRRHPKGKNIMVFKISLIIMDFILDILFVLNNGRNVPQLFIPSIIFCSIPIAANSIMSMIIILKEITRNESFYNWFKLNTNIAALFTILASADLEVLDTLSSQVGGIKLFNAPMSEKTQLYIFWGSLVGLFIEDIPQFIIQ
ncbi:17059_t:CDS:2, partial [Rhizophagus irregularis]